MSTSVGYVRATPATVQLTTGQPGSTSVAQDTGVITSGLYNGQALAPCFVPAGPQGTVTSVALTVPGVIFTSPVAGSPITSSGTLALALKTQTANTVFAGPTTGGATTPTMRALVAADIPTTLLATTVPSLNISTTGGELKFGGNTVYESDGASTYLSPSNDTTGSVYVFTGGVQRVQFPSTGGAIFSGAVTGLKPVASKTVSYAVVAGDARKVFDNTGGSGATTAFTLPAATVGLDFTFVQLFTAASSLITVTPNGTDLIAYGSKAAGNAITSPATTRSSIRLVCTTAGVWSPVAVSGTFT